MNNMININLDDVKDFLQTAGFGWNGDILLNEQLVKAENLSDFGFNKNLTAIKLHRLDNPSAKWFYQDLVITPTEFVFYNQTFDHSDIDATIEYEVDVDHTEQWVKFLLQRYGKEYQDYVKILCKAMRQREVNKAKHEFDKLTEIKKDIIHKLKAKLFKLQKLEDLVENVDELKK